MLPPWSRRSLPEFSQNPEFKTLMCLFVGCFVFSLEPSLKLTVGTHLLWIQFPDMKKYSEHL